MCGTRKESDTRSEGQGKLMLEVLRVFSHIVPKAITYQLKLVGSHWSLWKFQ